MNYQCIISGRVQGVYYRASIQKMASEAGFKGYVRNLSNGDVEACAILENEQALQQFIKILKTGSPYSHVEHITTAQIELELNDGFMIYH